MAWPAWCRCCNRATRSPHDSAAAAATRERSRSSGPATSGCPPRPRLARFGHTVVLAERDADAGWPRCAPGACPSSRPASTSWWPTAWRPAVWPSPTRPSMRWRAPTSSSSACPLPRVPMVRPTSRTWKRRPRRSPRHLKHGAIVVNKSTVPVGSATLVDQMISRSDVRVVSNPEFLREGTAVHDSLNPDRIVVGADDPAAAASVGRALLRHRGTADRDRHHDVGDDQVRLQRLPGHQAELRQRRWPACAKRSGPTPATSCSVSATTSASGSSSSDPVRAGADPACPRTPGPFCTSPATAGYDFSLLAGTIASNDEQLARVVRKVETAAGGVAGRRAGRRLGADLQGQHGRPPRLAERGGHPASGRAGRPRPGLRSHRVGPRRTCRDDLRGLELKGDPYEAGDGRPGARRPDRMGCLPLARLRAGAAR